MDCDLSLYGNYVTECEGFGIIETEHSFLTYRIQNEECYIRDAYVQPKYRRNRLCFAMLDNVKNLAIEKKCRFLSTTVRPSAECASDSMKTVLAYGFKVYRTDSELIWFIKNLR